MNEQELNLKIQALLESISGITSRYESQDADRRVELTLITSQLQDLNQKNVGLQTDLDEAIARVEELEKAEAARKASAKKTSSTK